MSNDNKKKNKVYVLCIDHRHGTDVSVHRTRKGVEDHLALWVATWWAEEQENYSRLGEQPADPADAVVEYFDIVDEEYYEITETTVLA